MEQEGSSSGKKHVISLNDAPLPSEPFHPTRMQIFVSSIMTRLAVHMAQLTARDAATPYRFTEDELFEELSGSKMTSEEFRSLISKLSIIGIIKEVQTKKRIYEVDPKNPQFESFFERHKTQLLSMESESSGQRRQLGSSEQKLWQDLLNNDLRGLEELIKQLGVDARNELNCTPLLVAAEKGSVKVVKALLSRGADINARDPQGCTPVNLACLHGHLDVLKLLVDAGADVNKLGLCEGYTVDISHERAPHYHRSALHNVIEVKPGQKGIKMMKMLLAAGANVSPSQCGYSPLHLAAENHHIEAMELLIAHGADVHNLNYNGGTPLFSAITGRQIKSCQFLFDHGANVNARDTTGKTPLMIAAWLGMHDIVAWLLEHKADPALRDKAGKTALEYVDEKKFQRCRQLLKPVTPKESRGQKRKKPAPENLPVKRLCNHCAKVESLEKEFSVCSACKTARYCCVECQRTDWKQKHKNECKEMKAIAEASQKDEEDQLNQHPESLHTTNSNAVNSAASKHGKRSISKRHRKKGACLTVEDGQAWFAQVLLKGADASKKIIIEGRPQPGWIPADLDLQIQTKLPMITTSDNKNNNKATPTTEGAADSDMPSVALPVVWLAVLHSIPPEQLRALTGANTEVWMDCANLKCFNPGHMHFVLPTVVSAGREHPLKDIDFEKVHSKEEGGKDSSTTMLYLVSALVCVFCILIWAYFHYF